jgi:hypothetical protein
VDDDPGIVEHNRVDLLSLIALLAVLARVYERPGRPYADPLPIARAHRRSGSESAALLHLREQVQALSDPALWHGSMPAHPDGRKRLRSGSGSPRAGCFRRSSAWLTTLSRLGAITKRRSLTQRRLNSQDIDSAAHQQRIARVRAKVAKLPNRAITFPDTAL